MQVTLSIRALPGVSKSERSFIKHYDQFISCEFNYLPNILSNDYMLSPFNYIGYTQNTLNICSQALFVIIDVDCTSLSIHDRLAQLADEGLQFIIATTSDSANLYRYRVLIPLDRGIGPEEYRAVVTGLRVNGLIPDMDTASAKPAQKFYSYLNSIILHNYEGSPLVVDDYLVDISIPEYRINSPTEDVTHLLHEFDSYRFATKGNRTKSLFSAAYKAMEYGLSITQVEQVVNYVNSLFIIPKPTSEVHRRVLNFIKQRK